MKRKVLAAIAGLAAVAVLAGCGTAAAGAASTAGQAQPGAEALSSAPAVASTPVSSAALTAEEAQAIALEHAGLTAREVTFVSTHLDGDDGRLVYEVEFYSAGTEYDYDVDAATGEVVGYDTDIENYAIDGSGQPAQATVDEAAAKAAALARVPGATEADMHIYLDSDDGLPVYEGAIVYQEMKYEFEISAADGTILEWEAESVYDD